MQVAGVLKARHTPDDRAVFVDVKTAWVIEGLGHGHEDVAAARDPQVVLREVDGKLVASAKIVQYTEITPDNMDSFHFHGDTGQFPLTSVIAVPHDDKSATLLMGRYLPETGPFQLIRPLGVVQALLQNVFKIQRVFNVIFAVVSVAMLPDHHPDHCAVPAPASVGDRDHVQARLQPPEDGRTGGRGTWGDCGGEPGADGGVDGSGVTLADGVDAAVFVVGLRGDCPQIVIPAQAGIHCPRKSLDSRLRGSDGLVFMAP